MPRWPTDEQRFWGNVRVARECWEWLGAKTAFGYGKMAFRGRKTVGAHRVSWMIHFGDIPEGMSVLHECDNPHCVHPAHLFLGTQKDNMRDAVKKGRFRRNAPSQKGERNSQARLTVKQVRRAKRLRADGWRQRDIAKDLGVSQSQVSRILAGKRWHTANIDQLGEQAA